MIHLNDLLFSDRRRINRNWCNIVFLTQVPFFSLFKNELRMISADLCESKHQLLQKMAVTADRPASKQIEVQTLGNSKWEKS